MNRLPGPKAPGRGLVVLCKAATPAKTTKGAPQQRTTTKTVSGKTTVGSKTVSSKTASSRQKQQVPEAPQQQKRRGSRFYFNITGDWHAVDAFRGITRLLRHLHGVEGLCFSPCAGFPFPIGPFFERKTVRNEVRCDQDWKGRRAMTSGLHWAVCLAQGATATLQHQRAACVHVASGLPTAACTLLGRSAR